MPDLTFSRTGPNPPVRMVCMYCGRLATRRRDRWVRNPRLDPPEGGSSGRVGGDPEGGLLNLILLPFVLVAMTRDLRGWWRHRRALAAAPRLDPAHTTVTVTTCDRHRRYTRGLVLRTVGLWAVLVLATGGLLAAATSGDAAALIVTGVVAVVLLPMMLLMQYGEHGPVRIAAVRRDSVILANVRPAYFSAPESP
jgi:hypothetical protein